MEKYIVVVVVVVVVMVVKSAFLHVGAHDPTLLEAFSVLRSRLRRGLDGTWWERRARA